MRQKSAAVTLSHWAGDAFYSAFWELPEEANFPYDGALLCRRGAHLRRTFDVISVALTHPQVCLRVLHRSSQCSRSDARVRLLFSDR